MILFLIVFVLLLLLPDLYIWLCCVRPAATAAWSALYWIPSLVALGALGCWMAGYYSDWLMKLFFGVLLCVALPKLIFVLLSLAGRAAGLLAARAVPAGNAAGIAVALIVCVAFAYGFTGGWKRLTVHRTAVSFADLPAAFDGYRIVQLSDLHVGTFGRDTRFVARLTERINALQPDLIVFTGDLVNSEAAELDPFTELLPQLRARDGVYSVLGNHDYCEYRRYDTPDGAARNLAELKRRQRDFGWQLLLNEHCTLRRGSDSIALIGVENDSRPPFPARGDLRRATEGLPAGIFKILLSHDPTHWRREVVPATDIRLTLSGHTHAMQLRIGGCSPAAWTYPEWGGLYREDDRMLHVSTGAGGTVPFRFGAWPAIDVITLHGPQGSDQTRAAQP